MLQAYSTPFEIPRIKMEGRSANEKLAMLPRGHRVAERECQLSGTQCLLAPSKSVVTHSQGIHGHSISIVIMERLSQTSNFLSHLDPSSDLPE